MGIPTNEKIAVKENMVSEKEGSDKAINNKDKNKKGKKRVSQYFQYTVDAMMLLIGITAAGVAYTSYRVSTNDAKTDLYVDFKDKYQKIHADISEQGDLNISIADCGELFESGVILGNPESFEKNCALAVFMDKKNQLKSPVNQWAITKKYWYHSFDEWFASVQLGLAEDLWDKYYRHAIFNSLQQHRYLQSICSMVNGDSSFGGKVMGFKNELRRLYQDDEVKQAYSNIWGERKHQIEISIPECFSEKGARSNFYKYSGFATQKKKDVFNCVVQSLVPDTQKMEERLEVSEDFTNAVLKKCKQKNDYSDDKDWSKSVVVVQEYKVAG